MKPSSAHSAPAAPRQGLMYGSAGAGETKNVWKSNRFFPPFFLVRPLGFSPSETPINFEVWGVGNIFQVWKKLPFFLMVVDF